MSTGSATFRRTVLGFCRLAVGVPPLAIRLVAPVVVLVALAGCPDPTVASDPPAGSATSALDGQNAAPLTGPPAPPVPVGPSDPSLGPGDPTGAPGAPTPGTAPSGTSAAGGRPQVAGFQVATGAGVHLSGRVRYDGNKHGVLRIDFLRNSPTATFPELLHTLSLKAPGEWSVEAPKDLGEVSIVAYIDADGNGPSDGEPAAKLDRVKVGTTEQDDLDLILSDAPNLGSLKPASAEGVPPPPDDPPPPAGATPSSIGAVPPPPVNPPPGVNPGSGQPPPR